MSLSFRLSDIIFFLFSLFEVFSDESRSPEWRGKYISLNFDQKIPMSILLFFQDAKMEVYDAISNICVRV